MLLLERKSVANRPMMVFRLNIGQHCGVDHEGETRVWQQGQRIKTPTHLTKRFGTEKFTRLSDSDDWDEGQRFNVEITEEALASINSQDPSELQHRMPVSNVEQPEFSPDENGELPEHFDGSKVATYNQMPLDELVKLAGEEEISLGSGKLTKKSVIAKLIENDRRLGQ